MDAPEANSTNIKPLTKRTAEGNLYIRRADAELQIEKVLTLEKPQIISLLSAGKRRDETDYLLDETLCYLLREARIAGDEPMFETIYLELNRRIWKLLTRFRGSNQADFEDFGQKVELRILRKLYDTESNSADFAQAQFGAFVVSEAKTVRKGNFVKLEKERNLFDAGREETGEYDPNQLENLSVGNLSDESLIIIREGLHKLSHEHQTVAAMLLDGIQIESKNADDTTICKHLGVSSRTIRYWIKQMRSQLIDYQGEARR